MFRGVFTCEHCNADRSAHVDGVCPSLVVEVRSPVGGGVIGQAANAEACGDPSRVGVDCQVCGIAQRCGACGSSVTREPSQPLSRRAAEEMREAAAQRVTELDCAVGPELAEAIRALPLPEAPDPTPLDREPATLTDEQHALVLRYVRVLTAGPVDRDALGREAHAAFWLLSGFTKWRNMPEDVRGPWRRVGERLFVMGRAAGDPLHGEGEALLEAASAALSAKKFDRATYEKLETVVERIRKARGER